MATKPKAAPITPVEPPASSRSCTGCPAFLKADEASSYFKKSLGAPMCARFGHVLGKPGLTPVQEARITGEFAKHCDSYGDPRPVQSERITAQVAVGDPAVMILGPTPQSDQDAVTSCLQCRNFVRPEAVNAEFGWVFGMCAATGRLLFPNRYTAEARVCEYRGPGDNRSTTSGIILKPVYEDAFSHTTDPTVLFLRNRGRDVIDPTEYPSDRPVEPHEAERGIRAWRRVDDQTGSGKFTHLPIFSLPDDENERGKVPRTGDDEHPEWYVDHNNVVFKIAVLWQELDETPAMWGMAGTGKTEAARHLAWLMCLPFDRISITDTSEVDDLIGKFEATDGSTHFIPGRIVKRWERPGVLLLDEPNVGPDAVWQAIRPLTDNSKQLVLDQHHGERVVRDENCYLVMAMNPAWDVKNVGARPISDADGNRLMHLYMDLPPEPLEKAILTQRCEDDGWTPSEGQLDFIMSVARDIRNLSNEGTLPISWGLRPQIKTIRALRWFDPLTCYRLATADGLDPEQQGVVLDVVRSYVDSSGTKSVF